MEPKALLKIAGIYGKVANAPMEYFKDLGIHPKHIDFLKQRYGNLNVNDPFHVIKLQGAAKAREDMEAMGNTAKKIGKGALYTGIAGGALGTAAYASS